MVTYAQAQERAERWINGDVPVYQQREVRVQEFGLGYVAWSEARQGGPVSEGARSRMVIARDTGDATLWPGLPVDEVIRRYEQEYGADAERSRPAPPREPLDLEATSFLLTPPEWLQEAADRMGVPDNRPGRSATPPPRAAAPAADANPWDAADTSSTDAYTGQEPPATVFAPPISGSDDDDTPPPPSSEAKTALMPEGSGLPKTAVSPVLKRDRAGSSSDPTPPPASATPPPSAPSPSSATSAPSSSSSAPSAPSSAPSPGSGPAGPSGDGTRTPPPPSAPPTPPGGTGGGAHHAATVLADPSQGGGSYGGSFGGAQGSQGGRGAQGGTPPPPSAPPAPLAADAATDRAQRGSSPRPSRGGGPAVPPPPGAPGTPGARPGTGGGQAPGTPAGGYAPTQLVSADDVAGQAGPATGGGAADGGTGGPGHGAVHHAATVLADPSQGGGSYGGPGGAPPPPTGPAAPGGPGGVHHAATVLAGPAQGGPGAPPPPAPPPPAPGMPPAPAPGPAGGPPPAYGYPPQGGQPAVGPGYMAVLRYRAADGSEQQLIRRSAPGTPHPEWQILHELRGMNVPPQQVLELHTELESCDLPGGYCARMIRETWPQVRVSHTAAYGRDHASRQQGMRHLVEHQGELHQVADAPPRHAPNRMPLPHVQPAPPVPPDAIGHELLQAFAPQGVFRFDQRAVSRQGVPDLVGQVLVWAGLPIDFGPFFWGQAQPGRPVPTLAELAQERGVRPAPDAGSYLVMGNDFGRQLCVQYGTAHIVAVPLEAGPGGQSTPPQFVNTGLPEFVRCMAMLGRMWRLRYGLTPEQAGRWTVDFQTQLAMLDGASLASPENWWSVLLEQMWDGLF